MSSNIVQKFDSETDKRLTLTCGGDPKKDLVFKLWHDLEEDWCWTCDNYCQCYYKSRDESYRRWSCVYEGSVVD